MTSIRKKLFVNLSLLIICFVLVSWGLSTIFLEPFYLSHKKQSMIENSQYIETRYNSDPQTISLELEKIANNLGASIVIIDPEGYIKFSSFSRIIDPAFLEKQRPKAADENDSTVIPKGPPPFLMLKSEEIYGQTVIKVERDPYLSVDFMVLNRTLNENQVLVMRLPLAAVSESAAYASKFIIITGLLSILVGFIWAFVFAKKFTVPLREISQIAKSISLLDFSQKCAIHSKDEIGALGKSINNLSCQLSKAISELNQKNQQLAADVEKERSLDKLRKNFISSVSHELKTPISLILGYAEGLQLNIAQDDESRNYYTSVIMDEAEKMDRLVKDLLNLSQIESESFHLKKLDFNVSSLIDTIVDKYTTILSNKNVRLEIEKQSQMIGHADPLRIEQIIVNLLNNALDHVDHKKIIKISLVPCGNKIRFCLFNTGKPIPEHCLNHVWLSFYKVDESRTREFGGYGLGLSIVRAIQELHGNRYGVENAPEGVLFWFEINKTG